MTPTEVLIQQLIIGLSNGLIIALIALGYTMVYGLVELINFAHGDLFMLGCFCALTVLSVVLGSGIPLTPYLLIPLLVAVPLFCGLLNAFIERIAYRQLRDSPKLITLVAAVGVSFILINLGLFWGGLPFELFGGGATAASPKDFPQLISNDNLLGESPIIFSMKDVVVLLTTIPTLLLLLFIVTKTSFGRSMRAAAQNRIGAQLMGINVDAVINRTFFLGGFLAGIASIVYALYNNTVFFQMGYRVGIDAFTAAVLGGIGNLVGAVVGGLLIGLIRAMSDQYIASQWTNTIQFVILIVLLVFRPSGLLGRNVSEKV